MKCLFVTALLLAVSSIGFAQAKKATVAPDAVVKNFYATHDAGKSPFFQSKNRALVDRYFTRELADLIWKDALCQQKNGGICNLDFNVPYATNGGDRKDASQFKIGKPEYGEGNLQLADVPVTFKLFATKANPGETITIIYRLEQGKAKDWKISDIFFPANDESSSSLKTILSADPDASQETNGAENFIGKGSLKRGATDSSIVYVGEESGDFALFCFANDSEVGRKILAACKDGGQCEFSGKVDFASACKDKDLNGVLSASGKITEINSVKAATGKRGAAKPKVVKSSN